MLCSKVPCTAGECLEQSRQSPPMVCSTANPHCLLNRPDTCGCIRARRLIASFIKTASLLCHNTAGRGSSTCTSPRGTLVVAFIR